MDTAQLTLLLGSSTLSGDASPHLYESPNSLNSQPIDVDTVASNMSNMISNVSPFLMTIVCIGAVIILAAIVIHVLTKKENKNEL